MRRTRQIGIKVIACVVLILMIAVLPHSCVAEPVLTQYEKNVNRITEIDYSKRQAELDILVEEGKMNVNYSSKAVFQGKVSEKFNIKNIQNNHYAIEFQLFDEEGNCIYQSKKIEPGYEMNSIELDKELSKGIHECKLQVGYAEEGNVSSAFPITIEVK